VKTRPVDAITYLVSRHGVPRERAALIADYICDRCANLSLATVHSSSTSALHRDAFLTQHMQLTRRQIAAWVALIRGTRPVRARDGRTIGGFPGMLQTLAGDRIEPAQMRRYERLAYVAATGRLPHPHHPLLPAARA
jgi:hypothetical protein